MIRRRGNLNMGQEHQQDRIRMYTCLALAFMQFKRTAEVTARKLKCLAKKLNKQTQFDTPKTERVAQVIRGAGSATAAVAMVVGFFTTGPLIPAFIALWSVLGVAGHAVLTVSDWNGKKEMKKIQSEAHDIITELDEKAKKVRTEMQQVTGAGTNDTRELDNMIREVEGLSPGNPKLRDLLNILQVLKSIPEEASQMEEIWTTAKQILNKLVNYAVAVCLSHASSDLCTHAWFEACNNERARLIECYSTAGKVTYVLGAGTQIATSIRSFRQFKQLKYSSTQAIDITNNLDELDSLTEEERNDRVHGLARQPNGKSDELSATIRFIFRNTSPEAQTG